MTTTDPVEVDLTKVERWIARPDRHTERDMRRRLRAVLRQD